MVGLDLVLIFEMYWDYCTTEVIVMERMNGIPISQVARLRNTLSAIPPLERLGWWAHLRYTIPKIPLEVIPGYRIASYSPRAHLATTPITDADRRFDDSLALMYHTFGVFVRPTRTFPVHVSLNYTITTEQSPNILHNDRFEADIVAAF